jgi:triosephosphate isomerase
LPDGNTSTKLRRPIVAGNWKLNPATRGEAVTLLKLLASNFLNHRDSNSMHGPSSPEVVIFPPLPYIADAVSILEGTGIQVGAQNVGQNEKGAFTGEIAPSMLVTSGCSYVLLGHSERRTLFGETNDEINASLHKCMDQAGLKVILCIGETLQEYEAGLLENVVDMQIRKGLEGIDASHLLNDRVIIAYEPVWAIGTGLVATPEQAQNAHVAIRNSLATAYGADSGVAEYVRIQYGGSVTDVSIESLMSENDIDGALVGGASLNADSFTRIFDGAATANARKKASMQCSMM